MVVSPSKIPPPPQPQHIDQPPSPASSSHSHDDDDDAQTKPKKRKLTVLSGVVGGVTGGGAATNPGVAAAGGLLPTEYRYTQEIGQMLYVFGEVVNPLEETSKLVEDIVRGQLVDILIRARSLTLLRSSRYLTTDDLLFLIRTDRSKVARLKNYLSWKDVRKRVKQDQESKGEEGEVEDLGKEDEAASKPIKQVIKLPWELFTPFTEFLRTLPTALGNTTAGAGLESDDEDEEELEAYEESIQRLRESDALTRNMTKEEYIHFSECRQASFTYRKAKKFRDFINHTSYLDLKPNDDVTDILGFLSFEMVRTLCVSALEVRRGLSDDPTRAVGNAAKIDRANQVDGGGVVGEVGEGERGKGEDDGSSSPTKEREKEREKSHGIIPTPPLQPRHIFSAYQKMQRDEGRKGSGGMGLRNFRGGVVRRKVAII